VDSAAAEDAVLGDACLAASWKCDLIYWALHALLLRLHGHLKRKRLGTTGLVRAQSTIPSPPPPILQPIIDFLQYEVFCDRVKLELERAVQGLRKAGVSANLRFQTIGENGQQLVALLNDPRRKNVTGEAVLRIDRRYVRPLHVVLFERI
jgi:mediator of RNA polymerase II transcription subunit 17